MIWRKNTDASVCGSAARARTVRLMALAAAGLLGLTGCDRRPSRPAAAPTHGTTKTAAMDVGYLEFERIGREVKSPPWIAHVNTIDLDADG